MAETVLTELQSACRAAHEQVQLLKDLYQHLSERAAEGATGAVDAARRIQELDSYQALLARKLEELDLLPKQPDPEREGLLELLTEVKAAFTAEDRPAVSERLAAEERELRKLTTQLLQHEDDTAVRDACAATEQAIANLSPPA